MEGWTIFNRSSNNKMDIFPARSQKMVLTEADVLELLAFLIASARSQIDDPAGYASTRLLSAFETVREMVSERVSDDTRKMLEETIQLTTDAQINMLDSEYYAASLDALNRLIATYLVEQSELSGKMP